MDSQKIPYEKQIFVCTNDRKGEKPSCGDHNGEAVFRELRRLAKEKGLHPKIRVAQAKCLGQCAQGVTVMAYSRPSDKKSEVGTPTPSNEYGASEPEGTWHKNVTLQDVPELAKTYLT